MKAWLIGSRPADYQDPTEWTETTKPVAIVTAESATDALQCFYSFTQMRWDGPPLPVVEVDMAKRQFLGTFQDDGDYGAFG